MSAESACTAATFESGTAMYGGKVLRKQKSGSESTVRRCVERIASEIRFLKQLQGCSHIVSLYEVAQTPHTVVMVMEWAETTLEQAILQSAPAGLATDDAPAERPSPPAASFLVPVEVPGTHVLSLPGGAPLLAEVVAGGAPAARVLTLRSRLALCNECQVAGPLPRPVRAPAARAPAGLPVVGP